MARRSIKHWFLTRFVTIAEVLGYALSLSVIGFAIYTVTVTLEVTVGVSGKAKPQAYPITAETDSAVVEYLVENGEAVSQGQEVARIADDPGELQRAMAYRLLQDSLVYLKDESDPQTTQVAESLTPVAATLPPPGSLRTLTAPASGEFLPAQKRGMASIIPEGDPIATVYDLNMLDLIGSIGFKDVQRTEVGMPVRLTHPDYEEPLLGEVAEINENEDGSAQIVLRFTDLPSELKDYYREAISTEGEFPDTSARIVVGEQTLFSRLFSRNR